MRDLYRLDLAACFTKHRGSGLHKYWGQSALAAVEDCFPGYDWKPWLFVQVSPGFWDSPANRRSYLDWLGKELGFRRPQDWYGIRNEDILSRHGSSLIHGFPSLYDIMREYLPQLDWESVDRYRRIGIEEILAWADAHHAVQGAWPTRESGLIPESGDTWTRDKPLPAGGLSRPAGREHFDKASQETP